MMNAKEWSKNYIKNLKRLLDSFDHEAIEKIASILWKTYQREQRIFVIGNGGSAATASHLACDFSKIPRGHKGDLPHLGFKAFSLTDNVPLITAWSNDTDYLNSYSEQLKGLGSKDDVLIAISSSGNSPNILKSVETAKELSMKIIGISGFGGGKLAKTADVSLVVYSNEYGPVEDIQLIVNHLLIFYFSDKLKKASFKI